MAINKGFIKDWLGNTLLPITRGELILDKDGNAAFESTHFLAADGHPGLVTAAERAMLTGSGGTGGIADIYTKLDHINKGLKVNGTVLNFYDANGSSTPINFTSTGDGAINIASNTNNVVNIVLKEVPNAETTVTQILKGITVDKYGRVTSVTSAALTNADIPNELTGKKLKDGILENAKTLEEEIGSDPTSVVNKSYVDAKVAEATGIATGALKFGGSINDASTATGYLSDVNKWNNYYKVTADLKLAKTDFYEQSGLFISGDYAEVKIGDTLIIYKPENSSTAKFIYIPSGDELTSITIRKGTADGAVDVLKVSKGNIILRFSDIFNVTNTSGTQVASISLPKANSTTNGYLSSEDYAKFNSYAESLKVAYTGEFDSGIGVYKIGTLTIGTTDKVIYGKYNISGLSLNNGTADAYNPILKFTETDAADVDITFKGVSGIVVKKNGNSVEFGANNTILEDSTSYLKVENGSKFGVKLGSLGEDNKVTEGLVNFSTVHNLALQVATTTRFESISYSLKGSANEEEYRYGNDKLKTAITITI